MNNDGIQVVRGKGKAKGGGGAELGRAGQRCTRRGKAWDGTSGLKGAVKFTLSYSLSEA